MKATIKYLAIWLLLTVGGFVVAIVVHKISGLLIPEYNIKESDFENSALYACIMLLFSQIIPIIVFAKRKYASYSFKFADRFDSSFSVKKLFMWAAVASVGCLLIEVMNVFNFPILEEWDKALFGEEPEVETSTLVTIIEFFSVCIFAPLAEEAVFRGAIERRLLEKNWNHWYAIIISAVIFALAHMSVYPFISPFIIVICWLYYRTRNLWPGILMHAVFNTIASVAQVVGEFVSKKPLSAETVSLPYSITIPLTLLGIAILYYSVKQIAIITRIRVPLITTANVTE